MGDALVFDLLSKSWFRWLLSYSLSGGNANITKNMQFQFCALVADYQTIPCNRWVNEIPTNFVLIAGGLSSLSLFALILMQLIKNLWQFFSHYGITVIRRPTKHQHSMDERKRNMNAV